MINLFTRRGAVRLAIGCAALVAGFGVAPAEAGRYDELYRAQAIVTGTGEANRAPGLAQSLEDVVVKVSGDPRLIGDPRVAAMGREAEIFTRKFTYRDRLEGIPIHDEQGSYDRPHDLIVDFNRLSVNYALRSLGRTPWTERRPRLAVFLSVERDGKAFLVTADGARDSDMRDSLAAAAAKVGLAAALPAADALAGARLDVRTLPDALFSTLETVATTPDADLPLVGALRWSDTAHGWIADWRLRAQTTTTAWRVSGVSFDDAFRNGMRGAAQVLSGNGQPDSDPES